MRIITWNINSLNARATLTADFLDAESPDVLVLQELKLPTERVPTALFTDRGYEVAALGQKSWNGVLIASKTPLSDVVTGLPPHDRGESRFIAATVAGLRIVNVYCPQGQSVDSDKFPYKLEFFDGLCAWVEAHLTAETPGLLLGDLNIAPDPDDVWDVARFEGIPTYHPDEHARFRRLLATPLIDVVKPRVPANTYSFWDYRNADFRFDRGMRIDHILATPLAAARVTDASVLRDWRKKRGDLTPSDHAPVAVTLTP